MYEVPDEVEAEQSTSDCEMSSFDEDVEGEIGGKIINSWFSASHLFTGLFNVLITEIVEADSVKLSAEKV